MKKKSLLLILLSTLMLCGCDAKKVVNITMNEMTINNVNTLPFNEKVSLSFATSKQKEINSLGDMKDRIWELHKLFDNKYEYEGMVNLCSLNKSIGKNEVIKVNDDLFYSLKEALRLSKLSKGVFNFTMGGVYDMWNQELVSFGEETPGLYKEDPFTQVDIDNVLLYSPHYLELDDYIHLDENNKTVELLPYHNGSYKLDFEQIKRGLTLDIINKEFNSYLDMSSLKIGYTSQEVMFNNHNKKWEFNLENPSFEQFKDGRLFTLEFDDNERIAVSTDAYKHYCVSKQDAILVRSDVLDGTIGKANNYYRQVALISKDAPNAMLDALSSVVFNTGTMDEVKKVIEKFEGEYNCSIDYILCKPYKALEINSFDVVVNENINKHIRNSSIVNAVKFKSVI